MAAHALLSASSSHQWLHCPASVRLTEHLPDKDTPYTLEGRLAHEIAELKVKAYFEGLPKRTVTSGLKKIKANPEYGSYYAPEMDGYTEAYLDYVKECALRYESKPYVSIEKRVSYAEIAPEGFGTCDCIMIGSGHLSIIDFKYGKGVPVSAEENPQLKLYALGAYLTYKFLYPITRVTMAIHQPRLDSVTEWEVSVKDLLAWGDSIKPIAQQAFEGGGEPVPGEHCRFCKIRGSCRTRAEKNMELVEKSNTKAQELSNEEIGELLGKMDDLKSWADAVKSHALSLLLDGEEIPGWKAVEGRSNRQFTDPDKALKAVIDSGIDEAILFERNPISLSSIEKLLGKKKFDELLASWVIKPPGKPATAPLTDKRPAIQNRPTAEEAFKDI